MNNLEKTIAQNAKIALAKTGKTQLELASALGLGKSKMSEVLLGKAVLTAPQLFRMSRFFGVSTDWFSEEHLEEIKPVAA